jgi:hypothetical protein
MRQTSNNLRAWHQAGLVVGLGGFKNELNLSSAALSFLAGYAIEPVFSTLDGIAEKFKTT